MKFWEAMRELEAGARIRQTDWPTGAYIHLIPDSFDGKPTVEVVGANCYKVKTYNMRHYMTNNWEVLS